MIQNYSDFVNKLLAAGFSMGGGNSEGIYAVVPWSWNEEPPYDTAVSWHTGNPDLDPWEWRIRVLDERRDIAYGKLFFRKSGFITREWYPCFLAARRGSRSFWDEYEDGNISHSAKRIYEAVTEHEVLPLHAIKQIAGFTKDSASGFDRALVELQTKMYLTMCGRQQKVSKSGEEYGWSSTVFCTVERYFGEEVFAEAAKTGEREAIEKIAARVYDLNPTANAKKVARFIRG